MLSFGTIIGVGWVTVMGSWLGQAGSFGSMLGFAGGGVLMLLIGLCYAEVATMYPVSGGEVAYVYEMFGTGWSFAAGWALAFSYIATTTFEAISVGWVASALFPGLEGPVLYTILGQEIRLWSLLLGIAIMALITFVNYRGSKTSTAFQDTMTVALLVASSAFIVAGLSSGEVANLDPLFGGDGSSWGFAGMLAVLATTPFWFAGFDTIPQAMGEVEQSARLKLIPRVIVASILLALIFYCLVILTSSMALPREDLLATELPVAGALEAAMGSPLFGKIVLFAGLCGLITTWNALFFAATRLLFALGKGSMIPQSFSRVHPRFASPSTAVLFVGLVGGGTALLGRNAIIPIVNAGATNLSWVFLMVCLGLIRLRKDRPDHPRPFKLPAGPLIGYLAAASSLVVLVLSAYMPFQSAGGGFPVEWILILTWATLGVLFWLVSSKTRKGISEEERRERILN